MKGRALAYRALDGSEALVLCTAISVDAVRVVRVAAFQTCMINQIAQRSQADGAYVVVGHHSASVGGASRRELAVSHAEFVCKRSSGQPLSM